MAGGDLTSLNVIFPGKGRLWQSEKLKKRL